MMQRPHFMLIRLMPVMEAVVVDADDREPPAPAAAAAAAAASTSASAGAGLPRRDRGWRMAHVRHDTGHSPSDRYLSG